MRCDRQEHLHAQPVNNQRAISLYVYIPHYRVKKKTRCDQILSPPRLARRVRMFIHVEIDSAGGSRQREEASGNELLN